MEDDPFDLIPHEEWYETAIRFGLYVGAAFQLCCILAIVVFPASSSDQSDEAHSAKVTHDRAQFSGFEPIMQLLFWLAKDPLFLVMSLANLPSRPTSVAAVIGLVITLRVCLFDLDGTMGNFYNYFIISRISGGTFLMITSPNFTLPIF